MVYQILTLYQKWFLEFYTWHSNSHSSEGLLSERGVNCCIGNTVKHKLLLYITTVGPHLIIDSIENFICRAEKFCLEMFIWKLEATNRFWFQGIRNSIHLVLNAKLNIQKVI